MGKDNLSLSLKASAISKAWSNFLSPPDVLMSHIRNGPNEAELGLCTHA